MSASEACKALFWLRAIVRDFRVETCQPTCLWQDNNGAIRWGNEGIRSAKHVAIRFNFVKDEVEKGNIILQYCPTDSMTADLFTKPLLREKFQKHREQLGLRVEVDDKLARGGVDICSRNLE